MQTMTANSRGSFASICLRLVEAIGVVGGVVAPSTERLFGLPSARLGPCSPASFIPAYSPIPIKHRMASEREGLSGCLLRQQTLPRERFGPLGLSGYGRYEYTA